MRVLGGTSLILFSVSVLTGCAASNDDPTAFGFTLGFEPDGYRSIQCTVRDLGPPETVSQSWPCADLHASGDVVVDYVLPEKPPGFFDYTVRVEIIDNDGKTASVERSFTVTWI